MELNKKVVVIIGGSQGFGRALAEACLKEGAQVIIVSKNQTSVEDTAKEIGAEWRVADVREEETLRAVADFALEKFGRIDIWVNSAGVFKNFVKEDLLDMERAHELFDINFFGTVLGARTALLNMKDGYIINILSSAALDASRAVGAKLYASSKWALRGYVEALRGENKDNAVKIMSVYPGGMKTHFYDEGLPVEFEKFMDPALVAEKVVANLKSATPEMDLVVKRPTTE